MHAKHQRECQATQPDEPLPGRFNLISLDCHTFGRFQHCVKDLELVVTEQFRSENFRIIRAQIYLQAACPGCRRP